MSLPAYKRALRSILPLISGGTAVRDMIVLCPIGDILRVIAFEPSAFSKSAFYVNATVLPLYIPRTHMSYQFGERLGSGYDIDDISYVDKIGTRIREYGMSILSRGQSVGAFLQYLERDAWQDDLYVIEAAAFSYALLGHHSLAIGAVEKLQLMCEPTIEWHSMVARRAIRLRAVIEEGDSAVHSLLASHRAETLHNLGLTTICST